MGDIVDDSLSLKFIYTMVNESGFKKYKGGETCKIAATVHLPWLLLQLLLPCQGCCYCCPRKVVATAAPLRLLLQLASKGCSCCCPSKATAVTTLPRLLLLRTSHLEAPIMQRDFAFVVCLYVHPREEMYGFIKLLIVFTKEWMSSPRCSD